MVNEGGSGMHNLIKLGALGAIACFAVAAPAGAQGTKDQGATKMTQAQCESLWNRADSAKSGSLTQTQAQPYVKSFSAVDANGDGRISRTEFTQGCSAGHVESGAGTGAGSGAGSSGSPGMQSPGSSGTEAPKK
jgi:hypothetical protein